MCIPEYVLFRYTRHVYTGRGYLRVWVWRGLPNLDPDPYPREPYPCTCQVLNTHRPTLTLTPLAERAHPRTPEWLVLTTAPFDAIHSFLVQNLILGKSWQVCIGLRPRIGGKGESSSNFTSTYCILTWLLTLPPPTSFRCFPMSSNVFRLFHSFYLFQTLFRCFHSFYLFQTPFRHFLTSSDVFHSSDVSHPYVIQDLVADTYHVAETRIVAETILVAALLWLTHKLCPASDFN